MANRGAASNIGDGADPESGAPAAASAAQRRALQTTFGTQANALLRKNLTFQKRNCKFNCCLICFPVFLLLLLFLLQQAFNSAFNSDKYKCGCKTFPNGTRLCGAEYSTIDQIDRCPIPDPDPAPAVLQIPVQEFRGYYEGLPQNCRDNSWLGCPTTILYTGANKTLAEAISQRLIPEVAPATTLGYQGDLVLGTDMFVASDYLKEAEYLSYVPLYLLQPLAPTKARWSDWYTSSGWNISEGTFNVSFGEGFPQLRWEYTPTVSLWRESKKEVEDAQYKGFYKANEDKPIPDFKKINELALAYDYKETSTDASKPKFDVNIYFNKTFGGGDAITETSFSRINQAMNMAVNAFLRKYFEERGDEIIKTAPLISIGEMPKGASSSVPDFASILGPIFFMWVIQLPFPVFLYYLVYDKEKNLRTMMKMHGLGDRAYYFVQYLYFLVLSSAYMFLLVLLGSAMNLKFFRINSYSIQFAFYFIFINNQIAFSFFFSSFFKFSRPATVVGYIYVFGSGLLGLILVNSFIEDPKFSSVGLFLVEMVPAFSLYRGLYEFSSYAQIGTSIGTDGMVWKNMRDPENGIDTVMGILALEWAIFLLLGYYLDQALDSGSGVARGPLFFLENWRTKKASQRHPTGDRNLPQFSSDVQQERVLVEDILASQGENKTGGYSILCDNLTKIYPARDGNPPKYAVRGMSLAVPRGQCFGMLGPNGAGKSSSINMMIGFLSPSEGTALIEGMDIRSNINSIYSIMGVCPQHDLLWETLTGREHLLFYGRLKNLKGQALQDAVDKSLKGVDLYSVRDKRAGKYSGGMKRRLSVAISLIGDPLVVYMDEPSTGLDPASRFNLWNVVKKAKRGRAIILTTHSMEEAEVLCDRLGIFVDGQFQCIGNPKELTARYGGTYVLTITTPVEEEPQAESLAKSFSPNANLIYSLSGTQKFEIPIDDIDVGEVFSGIEAAKKHLHVQAWGISNTTLEDVFIKVARGVQGESARLA
eukprot:TRINITY_DN17100_c0_g1_i1.p1 TRINITY_DN17100_c0_g1~~TRINITY_DN17100_c0_g1_i1.p1  ORF type:complete len:988 (-),score=185.09 TRINITY_DN17100_c0_g1_i1:153-3116(-)